MRIWSIAPKYLDSRRLTAQWREALLCRAVLEGKTKGYKKHPQFLRIKEHPQAHYFIQEFLYEVWKEGKLRGFKFDKEKLINDLAVEHEEPLLLMEVTEGQVEYEFNLLQGKLGEFHEQYAMNMELMHSEDEIRVNPCFLKVLGGVMKFEKTKE